MALGKAYIGTSGFAYDKWQGRFYPADIDRKKLLAYYAGFFGAVEINNSFYHLPTVKQLKAWQGEVAKSFLFCLKVSRFVSHNKKLIDGPLHIRNLFRAAKPIRKNCGPLLLQLPPKFRPRLDRLEPLLKECQKAGWPIALEVRQPDWYGPELNALLDKYGASLVLHDMPISPQQKPNDKAPFIYMRFHGPRGDYHGRYGRAKLNAPAKKLRAWMEEGRDVYVFFNNDADGFAPEDAEILRKLVSGLD